MVVVGAGLAGAATAYFLARDHGLRSIVVEREPVPGAHASGRNAAMIRQAVASASLIPALVEGARFLAHPPPDIGPVDRRATGSILLLDDARAQALLTALPALLERRVSVSWLERADVARLAPLAAGASFDRAFFTLDDGVVDVAALLHAYLAAADRRGARLLTGQAVRAVQVQAGRVCAVETDGLRIETRAVVNAAGAWCGELARLAGALDIPLRPTRRHLLATSAVGDVAVRDRPIVWDETHGLYFRPEAGGLLLSPCDETDHPPAEPAVDPAVLENAAEKVERFMPCLSGLSIRRAWAGLRTLSPDGRFVVGADPSVGGFFWCGGLGGHGVTASAAVGRMAADAVAGRSSVPPAHSPLRFAPLSVA